MIAMILDEPNHTAESIAANLAIRIYELKELSRKEPSPDILERIKLKEQLLIELRDYLARKNDQAK